MEEVLGVNESLVPLMVFKVLYFSLVPFLAVEGGVAVFFFGWFDHCGLFGVERCFFFYERGVLGVGDLTVFVVTWELEDWIGVNDAYRDMDGGWEQTD